MLGSGRKAYTSVDGKRHSEGKVAKQEDCINQAMYTDRDEHLCIDTNTKTREGDSPFAIDLLQ